jgi:hypothetical protein
VPAPPAAKPDGKTQGQADAPRRDDERNVSVQTPYADVDVDKQRGKVRVRAPYTNVAVDPDRGRVRVRAPYVNLDIRW